MTTTSECKTCGQMIEFVQMTETHGGRPVDTSYWRHADTSLIGDMRTSGALPHAAQPR